LLKIRLTRTGKKSQASYRVVLQEHSSPVKGKFIEVLGSYQPTTPSKSFTVDMDRVKHWISVGAQPSDSVAVQLKKLGVENMDQFIAPRTKQRKSKKEQPEEAAA